MVNYTVRFWKTAPFVRLVLPFAFGILMEYNAGVSVQYLIFYVTCFGCALLLFTCLPLLQKLKLYKLQGLVIHCLLINLGMLVTHQKDERNNKNWYGNRYTPGCTMLVKINEPLIEKFKSFKSTAVVVAVITKSSITTTMGKVILYFPKTIANAKPVYGQYLLINAKIEMISNSGNPGSFDYKAYCGLSQLYRQAYLRPSQFQLLKVIAAPDIFTFLYKSRDYILAKLNATVPGGERIIGIAEALLIGYKENLDKELLQSYSNTGVVHIIAISGLHLGLIYIMLVRIFNLIPFLHKIKIINVVGILGCLWLFSLLTGASASVLRSAVMFTCIVTGKYYFRQASIYNSLAASAFLLLIYNPLYLWDVGFQLSYLAVYGIVWLQKPVYLTLYVKVKWLRKIWEMASITIAAQIISFPICIYYFHQFPNVFLFTNITVVPLSTVILFTEILILAFSWFPLIANMMGQLCSALITLMNSIIKFFDQLPYARTESIEAGLTSTLLLYTVVMLTCSWFLYKKIWMQRLAIASIVLLIGLRIHTGMMTINQRKILLYNIQGKQAVDFISGDKYLFSGDTLAERDLLQQNYTFKPARIAMHSHTRTSTLPGFTKHQYYWRFIRTTIMLIDTPMQFAATKHKLPVDVLVLSKNVNINLTDFCQTIVPRIVIFDGSNSMWKIASWKKQCEQLLLPCFSITEQGAYVINAR